jgi:hypothetical protein
MATSRFDSIAKLLARRKAVPGTALSQAATPTAEDGERRPYLFVQSFEGGTIAPKEGESGSYTATLRHGLGKTLYFGDRPDRNVGAVPTGRFLEGLGFPDDNAPNAALVADDGNGSTAITVVELTNPLIDPTVPSVIYDLKVLESWESSTELGLQEAPADLADLPETLGPTHLFIDDCQDASVNCLLNNQIVDPIGPMGFCWNWSTWCCEPCRAPVGGSWDAECNATYGGCAGQCTHQFTTGCWV